MQVTDIRISPNTDPKLRAFVSVTFDDCFVVRGLKVIETAGRCFVAMPSRRKLDGSHQDIAHPIHSQARQAIEARVLRAYERLLQQGSTGPEAGS